MQIQNNTLIAECSAYDFKEMLERKKVKSWVKSVSAFANTDGGSLFYGVNDDGVIVGLENPQSDADFISETIKARLDPVPEIQLIPIEHEGHSLLEVKVKASKASGRTGTEHNTPGQHQDETGSDGRSQVGIHISDAEFGKNGGQGGGEAYARLA